MRTAAARAAMLLGGDLAEEETLARRTDLWGAGTITSVEDLTSS